MTKKFMIIGIDASRANKPQKTGTEWYSYHLIEELKRIARDGDKFLLYANSPLIGGLQILPENFIEKDLQWPPKYLWTQIRLWWELWRNPPDILLVPAHTIPFLPMPKKIKVAVTVHDVGFKRFAQLYKPVQVWYHDLTMRRIKQRADLIITISNFSKKEIIDLYHIDPSKIQVSYLGYDRVAYNEQAKNVAVDVLKKYQITDPYVLYVGRLEKKKNIGNIVAAFALAKEKWPELKLVLAGNSGHQFEEIKKIIAENRLESEVIITGYIDQKDLPPLIAGAQAFLFATLYEGFGLPILEAMACGTPVITSRIAPHDEVAGEAALLADPYSPPEMAECIIKLKENPEFKNELITKGLERVKKFSWQQTARVIYNLIA